jgi:hypothetical protein
MKRITLAWLTLLTALVVGCSAAPTPAAPTLTPMSAEPTPIIEATATLEMLAAGEPTTDTNEAGPPETTEPTEPGALTAFNENGVSFSFDSTLASGVTAEVVPASATGGDLPYWGIFPEHRKFNLEGYESQNSYHQPSIYVYPVEAFAAKSQEAQATIQSLQTLLNEQPDNPETIPVLPILNATQVTNAQVRYLSFASGTGVRFVTQYDQSALPINNQGLCYTFQGLTSDGQFYVAATLPVSAPGLAKTGDVTLADPDIVPFPLEDLQSSEDPAAALQAYVAEVTERLELLDPASYTPSLTLLDEMVQTIRVE